MAFDLTWANVNSVAIAPAALQVLIGGVITSCKLWIPTEERLRDSVELKREALRESVSRQLHSLLTIAEASISSELRGSPPQSPDHVGDFIKSFFRVAEVFREIDRMYRRIRICHSYLLLTVCAGIISLLVSIAWPASTPIIAAFCSFTIVTQLLCVYWMRKIEQRFEDYERIT